MLWIVVYGTNGYGSISLSRYTQSTITCPKLTTETLEQGVKCVQS